MLVKPQTFTRSGRYPTAAARAQYLQRDGREAELATRNIVDERNWAREMDRTTESRNLRGDVVGREYILSPSPDDNVTPARMLDFAMEWAEENFPDSEVAVVIHEDNKERTARGLRAIAHAHVYVNAPDLETGRKMQVSNARIRELHDSAQRLCEARGWSSQERYFDEGSGTVRYLESNRSAYERRPQWERLTERANPEYENSSVRGRVTQYEYEQAKGGRELDKTYIRRAIKESLREVSDNRSTTLREALEHRGVTMDRAANGDFKYGRTGSNLMFRGKTLGDSFAQGSIERDLMLGRSRSLDRDGLSL